MIYLDNAATSWPKPKIVTEAMIRFSENIGASAGRSGHRLAARAEQTRFETREVLAKLFHIEDPLRIIFTMNATEALNLVINGILRPGDHVITTSMEHNSVMRPLIAMRETVSISVAECESDGTLQAETIAQLLRANTRLVVMNHASNVCGTILPVQETGEIVKSSTAYFLVDAAQTAGSVPINMKADRIDFLAFTGHKSLLGPTGTGGLAIGDQVDINELKPLTLGGTGSLSEKHEQPNSLPDKYESGTCNMIGIAGLNAGINWLLQRGLANVRSHDIQLTSQLIDGLLDIPNVYVYGTRDATRQTATVSFNISGKSPSEVGFKLDDEFSIFCRVGLHCAPSAHRTLKTFPEGTVRFAMGNFNTQAEIREALSAIEQMVRRGH